MAITIIRNQTRGVLELWDAGKKLKTIPVGGSLQQVPITITQVTRSGVILARKKGGFANDDSYVATYANNSVVFTGNTSVVTFT